MLFLFFFYLCLSLPNYELLILISCYLTIDYELDLLSYLRKKQRKGKEKPPVHAIYACESGRQKGNV